MKLFLSVLTVTLAGVTVAPAAAVASDQYRTIDLGTLGGKLSHAMAVNDNGHVVGWSNTAGGRSHAFLWRNGVLTDLGALEDPGGSIAFDINDAAQVVGESSAAQGTASHAVLWDRGVLTDLGTLGGSYSSARAINNRGQIVGYSEDASGARRTFLWERGVMSDLGVLDVVDINDHGQIVGSTWFGDAYHGFLLERGHLTDLGELTPVAINDKGWVTGHGPWQTAYVEAYVWRSGVVTRLGPPGAAGLPRAINDHGDIVGVGTATGRLHPFLWRDGVMVDLTTRGIAADAMIVASNNRRQLAGAIVIELGFEYRAALFECRRC